VLTTDSFDGKESRPITEFAVIGVYGWNADWLAGGRGGMPIGWGACAAFDLALVLIKLPIYWTGGLGEVAEETEEESYDLVDGFGDRGK
jgi:hypothetical protein